jgi:hypothetical protein
VVKFKVQARIFLEGLRKTTVNFSYDNRCVSRYLNPEPPEYQSGVLRQSNRTFGSKNGV